MNLLANLAGALCSAAKVNRSLMVRPAATLWTDAERIWANAAPHPTGGERINDHNLTLADSWPLKNKEPKHAHRPFKSSKLPLL